MCSASPDTDTLASIGALHVGASALPANASKNAIESPGTDGCGSQASPTPPPPARSPGEHTPPLHTPAAQSASTLHNGNGPHAFDDAHANANVVSTARRARAIATIVQRYVVACAITSRSLDVTRSSA